MIVKVPLYFPSTPAGRLQFLIELCSPTIDEHGNEQPPLFVFSDGELRAILEIGDTDEIY